MSENSVDKSAAGKGRSAKIHKGSASGKSRKPSVAVSSAQDKSPHKSGLDSRLAAVRCVAGVLQGHSATELMGQHLKALSGRDKALASEIIYGTLRHLALLDHNFTLLQSRPGRIDLQAKAVVLTALYQISLMDQIPSYAAVNAAVSCCYRLKLKPQAGFVNAVLRSFLRQGGTLQQSGQLTTDLSCPQWLYERLQQDFPVEQTLQQILQQSNQRAPMFLRVETAKISVQDYLQALKEAGIAVKNSQPSGLIELASPCAAADLPGLAAGLVCVQDASAQLPVQLLELGQDRPLQVLDCCCAPGGKSAQILNASADLQLTACDSDPARLYEAACTLVRLGHLSQEDLPAERKDPEAGGEWVGKGDDILCRGPRLVLKVADAASLNPQTAGLFDRILIDAPCSGTGVIRRHPDIKWLRRGSDIARLTRLQEQILEAALSCLKPGGILVYSTCSILKAENEEQIRSFAARHPQLQPYPFVGAEQEQWFRQILPGEEGGDGFFYARLRRAGRT